MPLEVRGVWRLVALVVLTAAGGAGVDGGRLAPAVLAAPLSAPALFADAQGKEAAVRRVLEREAPPASVVKAVRAVLTSYESLVRHYPSSGYADDALWRAAQLASDASRLLNDATLQTSASRFLRWLATEYPASKYARDRGGVLPGGARPVAVSADAAAATPPAASPTPRPAVASVPASVPTSAPASMSASASGPASTAGRVTAGAGAASPGGAPTSPPPAGAASRPQAGPAASPSGGVTAAPSADAPAVATSPRPAAPAGGSPARLLAVHRVVLPDAVRVTFDIDREVVFQQERLANPARIYFDLQDTASGRSLNERTLRFEQDADVIRYIRVGQPAADTVRVVLDAVGVASCQTFPLYAPFRLVADCTRTPTALPSAADGAATTATARARPKPLTPATFARRPASPALPGTTPSAAARPAPVAAPPLPPLVARRTVPLIGMVPPLVTRTVVVPTAAPLPAGATPVPSAVFAALVAEMEAPPVPPPTPPPPTESATLAETPGGRSDRTPSLPARNSDGSYSLARQLGLRVSRIVIDPGHGGHDPGASGGGTTEAALVLDIALRLERLLLASPGVEVILTRRTDEFVALEERTEIANRSAADLFLSIHTNASPAAQAAGIETYYLNFANSPAAAAVAARENAASGQPMSALPDIVKAIALGGKHDESRDFAMHVQRTLVQKLTPAHQHLRDLGVKQAPFVVLIGASMPSVLTEVAFITNEQEARLLKGQSYRQRIAEGLHAAVQRYQQALSRLPRPTGQ